MAHLTTDQLQFLKLQRISPSFLFDGTGLTPTDRKQSMETLGRYFYYGGAPCKEEGHTLRTKAGHCIQCDTAKIAYQLRNSASGYVYLAYSKSSMLLKIGYTKHHPQDRGLFLRKENYGNVSDWDIKKFVQLSRDAGEKRVRNSCRLGEISKNNHI